MAMAGEGESGLEGTVAVSPVRPGPTRIGEPDKGPAAHLTFVVRRGEEKVATFTTDAAGHFHVALPPGHYVVRREDPGSSVGHWSFEADVVAGKITKVEWTGDSGMQ